MHAAKKKLAEYAVSHEQRIQLQLLVRARALECTGLQTIPRANVKAFVSLATIARCAIVLCSGAYVVASVS